MNKFFHSQEHRRTICINVPNIKDIFNLEKEGSISFKQNIVMWYGVAKLNPMDKFYVKSVGRSVAQNKMRYISFDLQAVAKYEDGWLVDYMNGDGETITLKVMKDKDRAIFLLWSPNEE